MTILTGAPGLGQVASVRQAAAALSDWRVLASNGCWLTGGYLGGFHELVEQELTWVEAHAANVLVRHEQTLKRLFPTRSSTAYTTPKDLTNSTGREERTRFYHSEYQNKLLVGLSEFLIDVLDAHEAHVLLIIEDAGHLSPTSQSLLELLCARNRSAERLRFVLLDEDGTNFWPSTATVHFDGYPREVFYNQLDLSGLKRVQRELIFRLSHGNLRVGRTLRHCFACGVVACGYLDASAVVDLYLSALNVTERTSLLVEYVRSGFSGDLIAQRNAETFDPRVVDSENEIAHALAFRRFEKGEGPLVLGHALAINDPFKQIESLVKPCEALMGIGLYDTWFSFFAPLFANPELRVYGDGNSPVNGLFVNAAFVLYAMGNAHISSPFIEGFLEQFPRSRFVPTALYAQSMTYGRYQIPVDLVRAETYAVRNLALIDEVFGDHEKYTYIKVFAENAYAYIKSRQGHFTEALEYCERGNAVILASYGEDRFRLHRSILIYNTSQIYELVGDLMQAEARLCEAIACDPYYAEYHNDLGNLLSRIDDRELEALEAYERAISLSPPYYEAHLNRGVLYNQLGRPIEALADLERALEIKPEEWRAMREMGNAKLQQGDALGALEAYTNAVGYEDRDSDLHANIGLSLSSLGDSEGAIRHYLTAIRLNTGQANAHNNLAAEFLELGRFDEALFHARLAAKHGKDPDFITNLVVVEARLAARS